MKRASQPSRVCARTDWTRVNRASLHLRAVLGSRFNDNGHVETSLKLGWLRNRLRELLEPFPSCDAALIWVQAAAFKAQGGEQPMAHFAALVNRTTLDPSLLHPRNLLSPDEHRAWLLVSGLEWCPDPSDRRGPG